MDLYDFAEAAERIGVAEGTLRHWVAKRRVRHHRIGGGKLVRFTDEDIAAALQPVEPLPVQTRRPRRRRAPRQRPAAVGNQLSTPDGA
jgi:excisionase family DNA binding protein